MPSLQSHLLVLLLRATRRKGIYSSVAALLQGIAQVRKSGPAKPSAGMQRRILVEPRRVAGLEMYRLSPRVAKAKARHVLYLHGGAYVRPITSHHWRFLQALVEETGCIINVPLYPLAPEASCSQAVPAVVEVYQHACVEAAGAALTVIGDSAGGGLAVALCYALRKLNIAPPISLVLISPWLDVTLKHPRIAADERFDPMLAVAGCKEAGRLYAGELALDHPYVSPINGDLHGLPATLLFTGTRDIAHHDALLFADMARSAGVQFDLQVGAGMLHVWPILPVPEGKLARATIARHLAAH